MLNTIRENKCTEVFFLNPLTLTFSLSKRVLLVFFSFSLWEKKNETFLSKLTLDEEHVKNKQRMILNISLFEATSIIFQVTYQMLHSSIKFKAFTLSPFFCMHTALLGSNAKFITFKESYQSLLNNKQYVHTCIILNNMHIIKFIVLFEWKLLFY